MRELKKEKTITPRGSIAINAYMREISKIPLLSVNEEVELCRRVKEGDISARDKLIKANLRFVVTIANQYSSKGFELEDLVNEGNIGLIRAAELYDDTRGFKFISYAVWWIRQTILQAIAEKSSLVRLPFNVSASVNKYKRLCLKYEQLYNRPPTDEEVAEELGLTAAQVKNMLGTLYAPVSTDKAITNDTTVTLGDMLTSEENTDDSILLEDRTVELNRVIRKVLSGNEITIIKSFYGIGTEEKSLDTISNDLNLSRERVRQIFVKSLKKLRLNSSLLRKYA